MIERNQKGDYDPVARTEGIEMEPARGKALAVNGEAVEKDRKDAKGDDKNDPKSKSKDPADKPVAFYRLFRFADRLDYALMFFGFMASMIKGAALPLFSLVFGSMSDEFNQGKDALLDAVSRLALYLFLIGVGTFFLSAIAQSFWMISGERQSIRYRYNYFQAVLHQNVGWYDSINPNELAAKIANETFKVQGAIGEKVATFVMTIFIFIVGFAIGFAKGWQLSLVIAASLPVITLSAFFFVYVIQNITTKSAEGYSSAGANAEQALSGIKTVKALVGEEYESSIYFRALNEAKSITVKYGLLTGMGLGFIYFCMFADYGLGFWFGSKLIEEEVWNGTQDRPYSVGDVLSVFFCIIFSAFSLGQAAPCFKNFALGQQAGAQIFKIIDRVPEVIIDDKSKPEIGQIETDICINNVSFKYPTRDVLVADGVSINILKNKKNALVGESGSGKSTILQLIERFYDPNSGSIEINGKDIRQYNLKSLRKKIGYVGQEPVLFATTIRENLRYGKEDATEDEMISALKASNAWPFIEKLEHKLDTYVGVAGGQFSGGQKQRIAIARAILKNPPILLLDEATSALDRVSEKLIQKTLDEISKGRTSITIAHRLSTVQNSDRIFVFDQGKVVEYGTHEELLSKKGKYFDLVNSQLTHVATDPKEVKASNSKENNMNDLIEKDNEVVEIPEPLVLHKKESHSHKHSKHETEEEKHKRLEEEKKQKAEEKKKKAEMDKQKKQINKRLMTYSRPERLVLVLGVICSLLNGVVMPFFGLVLGEMMDILARPKIIDDALSQGENIVYKKNPDFRKDSDTFSLLFLILAILSFLFNALQTYLMSIVAENLTLRVRNDLFNKILRMPLKWFDQPKNNPGTLSARLAVDANLINGLTSTTIGIAVMSLGAFIGGLIISFYHAWELTLVSLAVSPLLMYSGKVQAEFAQGFAASTDEAYKESGGLIMESVTNIRTVASFSNENLLLKIFENKLEFPKKQAIKRGATAGLIFGFSQMTMFAVYAIIFKVGAHFMVEDWMDYKQMYISIFAIMFASFSSGNASQFMPDAGAGYNAARAIFEILDDTTEIQLQEEYNKKIGKNAIKQRDVIGEIEFRNVSFKYPTREKLVLDNLSFIVKQGQKIALVGSSGCGKSTCLQLLMRFYDVESGEILLDGVNIKDYDVQYLRSIFGVVSQEPVLFNGTVAYNIKYNNSAAGMKEIEEAADKANALTFIKNNQFDSGKDDSKNYGTGFDRKVGPKGSQISGGQKQRIAIARAILKQPRILLLDEATSALDAQSEIVVQESLNNLMKNKTSLTVAHRISTIKDSDSILVFDQGKIIERGTYNELISKRGFFYNFELGIEHDK